VQGDLPQRAVPLSDRIQLRGVLGGKRDHEAMNPELERERTKGGFDATLSGLIAPQRHTQGSSFLATLGWMIKRLWRLGSLT
jgi:hypothetical protein